MSRKYNQRIHHFKIRIRGKQCIENTMWCGKRTLTDFEDEPDFKNEIFKEFILKPEMCSPELVLIRATSSHCPKCIKEKALVFGKQNMIALGYPIKNYRGMKD